MKRVVVGLSGGVDSPLITYYANKSQQHIKAFSIGSEFVPSTTFPEMLDWEKLIL